MLRGSEEVRRLDPAVLEPAGLTSAMAVRYGADADFIYSFEYILPPRCGSMLSEMQQVAE